MSAARNAVVGGGLVALYTLMISGADGITKFIAGSYAAPQLFVLSSALVLVLSLVAARLRGDTAEAVRTSCHGAMALRSVLTVLACVGFFQAFRLLPFADVFLFIGLMPLIAAALSGPVLGEPIRPVAMAALCLGSVGLLCLLPAGFSTAQAGHAWAAMAALTGTGSMLAARHIGRIETVPLAQVFWPNAAILVVMGVVLPMVWRPMGATDLAWVALYAVFLFAARWIVVEALQRLPAYVATPLMNLQFVWMVMIGYLAFNEVPGAGTLLGVALVIGSGLWLVADESAGMRGGIVRALRQPG